MVAGLPAARVTLVDPAPSVRKVQALARIGWSMADMAEGFGVTRQSLFDALNRPRIKSTTASKIDAWYRKREMRPAPDGWSSRRTRARAERNGWPAPLDWEDIDSGVLAEVPPTLAPRDRFDTIEIDYFLDGNWKHPLSRPERVEALRRWLATGRSERSLCRLTGWRGGRYRESTS